VRVRRLPILASVAAVLLATAPAADAQAPALTVTPQATQTGWIGVRVQGPPGAVVALSEGGRAIRTVTLAGDGVGVVQRLTAWTCEATTRRIDAAVAGVAPASTSITTPACSGRFGLSAPRSVRAGAALRVRVTDRWGVGATKATVCLRMRGRTVDCASGRSVRLFPVRPGRASVELEVPGAASRTASLRVRARTRGLRVLAAGDSMIQVLDAALADRLDGARVRSDAHVSTGITKPAMLNWPAQARRLARQARPDATVVFLGANDGFGLPQPGTDQQAPCCTDAWVAAYAARARSMMAAYARNGAGRVYWLTLPAPRSASFAKVFTGVNAALRRAARAYPAQVRIIDLGRVFTPGGRFRQTLRRDGKAVDVRQADGVHLSPAGDAIAAGLVVSAMRRDGLVS
jgi:lysophospholipase L1-like esterase